MAALPARADLILNSNNSQVKLDPASQTGIYSWIVDGKQTIAQQWFWLRMNSDTREHPVDASYLTLTAQSVLGTNRANLLYTGPGYTVNIKLTLLGGSVGSLASDLSEIITIRNTSRNYLDVNFFQYTNIAFSQGQDTTHFIDSHSVDQSGALIYLNETVVNSSGLVHHQAGVYPNTLNSLNDNGITTLNDVDSAYGNATWAFQWFKHLGPGDTLILNEDMNVSDPPLPSVPEPGSLLLLGTVTGLIGWRLRRRGAKSLS